MDDSDPFVKLKDWLALATGSEPNDPNAMALATVDADGWPSVRMVLLKAFDQNGLIFYSNSRSRKGRALQTNAVAAVVMHWKSLLRQVRAEGHVSLIDDKTADAYFASRPRESQLGAWASHQSRLLDAPENLLRRQQEQQRRFADMPVPRPPYWVGYRLVPIRMEFWRQGEYRLHERISYRLENGGWTKQRLQP